MLGLALVLELEEATCREGRLPFLLSSVVAIIVSVCKNCRGNPAVLN